MVQNRPAIVDLCSGCGGMSLGFEMAGFEAILACELDPVAAETYSANHPKVKVVSGDMSLVADWSTLIDRPVAGVIGGVPCQGFSLCGSRDPSDPRNSLFMEFAKCVRQLRPKFFVMENVPGILSMRTAAGDYVSKIIVSEFRSIGYDVFPETANSVDCGVPQSRERTFFIGFLDPMGVEGVNLPFGAESCVTVDMAISDLPQIVSGEGGEVQYYAASPRNAYQEWARIGNHLVRNHVAMKHTKRLIKRFGTILPGQSVADVAEEHSAVKRGDSKVKSGKVYGQNNMRVWGNRPCPTVAASFQSNFIHPHLDRNFTAREAARLQSFPDSYVFMGKRTKMSWEKGLSQYQQIGNAVPPLMAKAVALAIIRAMPADALKKGC